MIERVNKHEFFGRPLGEVLNVLFNVPKEQVELALQTQKKSGGKLGEILTASKQVTYAQLAQAFAAQMDLPYRDEVKVAEMNDQLPDSCQSVLQNKTRFFQ